MPLQTPSSMSIRPLGQAGDLGWVVLAQSEAYARDLGWIGVEDYILTSLIEMRMWETHPLNTAWVAEVGEDRVGCLFLEPEHEETRGVPGTRQVGRLRMLFVEPTSRGRGIGQALVARAIDHARGLGAEALTLWSTDLQGAANTVFERAGFELQESFDLVQFDHQMKGQSWHLEFVAPAERPQTLG